MNRGPSNSHLEDECADLMGGVIVFGARHLPPQRLHERTTTTMEHAARNFVFVRNAVRIERDFVSRWCFFADAPHHRELRLRLAIIEQVLAIDGECLG